LARSFLFIGALKASNDNGRKTTGDMANLAEPVRELIEPTIESMGFELVRVAFSGDVQTTLQIMAERPDGTMTVENCASISRAVSAILDVEDPIAGEYNLEVSSPGIDRPLVRLKDFERFAGHEVRVVLASSIDGQRKFRGQIIDVQDDHVHLANEHGTYSLAFADIATAQLVLTDELIDAHLAAEAAANESLAASEATPAPEQRD
jgi:ribosome maturation factor RimP